MWGLFLAGEGLEGDHLLPGVGTIVCLQLCSVTVNEIAAPRCQSVSMDGARSTAVEFAALCAGDEREDSCYRLLCVALYQPQARDNIDARIDLSECLVALMCW